MKTHLLNRRHFVRAAGAALIASTLANESKAATTAGVSWPIGCFNRPWGRWDYDETLDRIKSAGYKLTGLLGRHKTDLFVAPEATPEYLAQLRKRIAARDLAVNMGAMRSRHNVPHDEAIREVRQQIDNAARLELRYLMSFGTDRPSEFEHYWRVMAEAAAYAEKRGVQIVLKPHGGISGASEEILRCVEKVSHPNFRIWYDAGNIIHYTGKDPVAELGPIAHLVTGFCAKDCARPKGEVMIQFGEGKVDFKAVFKKLKDAGFNGPIMVECCAGQTLEEVTTNAQANRQFLEKVLTGV